MNPPHAVVVLAAGGSARLGQPKQLLTIGGETLVHRAARLAGATSPVQTVVVTGAQAEAVAAAVADLGCRPVFNPAWRSGMAGSLHAAGLALAADAVRVLVLACDQPALLPRHLDALLDGAAASPSGCGATRYDDARGVPAVVPRHWFSATALGGDAGFAARLRSLPASEVYLLDAPALGCDIDTPLDLARAREAGWIDP